MDLRSMGVVICANCGFRVSTGHAPWCVKFYRKARHEHEWKPREGVSSSFGDCRPVWGYSPSSSNTIHWYTCECGAEKKVTEFITYPRPTDSAKDEHGTE